MSDMPAEGETSSRWLPLIVVGSAALALRIPLLLLPGPGRDEATYFYWAHHPELSYAPLLQWLVRGFEFLGSFGPVSLPDVILLRLPSLFLGFAVLYLVDARLVRFGASSNWRWLCLVTVGLCEWQTFTGSILHPDLLLLASLLLMVMTFVDGRVLLFGAAACAAALSKPTGILALGVGLLLVGRIHSGSRLRVLSSRIVMVGIVASLVLTTRPELLGAIADFGRLGPNVAWATRMEAGLLALLVAGGPLLLILGAAGGVQRVRSLRAGGETSRLRTRESQIVLALASTLLLAFGMAALLRGQFKANWVLPAAVLLLPVEGASLLPGSARSTLRRAAWALAGGAAVVSLLVVIGHHRPELVAELERGFFSQGQSYTVHAGSREARVSSSRSWAHRLAEYGDMEPFARSVAEEYATRTGAALEGATPNWIATNDYGLAAQLAWYWHNPGPRIVLWGDSVIDGTPIGDLGQDDSILMVEVEVAGVGSTEDRDFSQELTRTTSSWTRRHPITDATIILTIARPIADQSRNRSSSIEALPPEAPREP